jgi:uncharacterized membrane protein
MFSLIAVCGMFISNRWRKNPDNATKVIITPRFVALYITFTLAWYMYVSSSSAFEAIVRIGDHIVSSIFTDFLNPEAAEGVKLIMWKTVSPLHDVTKYLHLISQFFIVIGIYTLLAKRKEMKFKKEYAAFSYVNFMICFAGIAVPFFASSLNTSRLYHITLIFLAPFCVIGGMAFFRMVDHVVKKSWTDRIVRSSLRVLSVFFAVFLLFNSGWVYEVAKDNPGSISLSQEWIKECGGTKTKASFYTTLTPEQEVFSAKWLSKKREHEEKVYATYNDIRVHALTSYGMIPRSETPILTNTTENIEEKPYVYLQHLNVIEGIGTDWDQKIIYDIDEIFHLFDAKSKIYSNGASEVYK